MTLVITYTKGCWRGFAFKHNAISKESFAKDKFEGFKRGVTLLGIWISQNSMFFMIVV
jgi:hypothetical protein